MFEDVHLQNNSRSEFRCFNMVQERSVDDRHVAFSLPWEGWHGKRKARHLAGSYGIRPLTPCKALKPFNPKPSFLLPSERVIL